MTDTTQGQDTQDDRALFSEATSTDTLDKFENPAPQPAEPPPPPPPPADPVKPEPKAEDSAPVPSGRFREEAEARRRAERERDELQRRLEAAMRPQPQRPLGDPPKPVDMFENPQGFVRQEMAPFLEQIRSDLQSQREAMSLNYAIDRHGADTVSTARQALEQGMQAGDPQAWSTYNRVMQSHDPYGVIVKWHRDGQQLREIGGDLEAYRKRILEEALSDPEFRKKAIENVRTQASNGGATQVFRPAGQTPSAPSPSLGDIGASAGEPTGGELSDVELFRAATRAKRR